MKIRIIALLMAFLTLSLLTACGTQSASAPQASSGTDAEKRTDVIIAQAQDPSSLDPHYCYQIAGIRIYQNMFESLLKAAPDGSLSCLLAESYSVSDDGLVYTFKLRKDVVFQNGDPMTAADVKWSFDRACASAYCAEATLPIASTDIVDDYTVDVTLKYPYAAQLPFFATTYLAVVNQKVVDELGDSFGMAPKNGGTGPYIFDSWTKGAEIVMARNENYWAEKPAMTKLTYKIITEASAGDIAVETGDIDLYLEPSTADIPNMKENAALKVYEGPSYYIEYLAFNMEVAPLDDPLVRQAIAKSFDKSDIVTVAVDNIGGLQSAAYTNPNLFGAKTDYPVIEKDIEGAKALLAEAGYPNGFSCTITAIDGARKKSAQVIQAGLKEIGIDAQIDIMESGAYFESAANGQVELCCVGMTTLAADADPLLYCCFSSENIGVYNFSRYSNAEVDQLFADSRANADTTSRAQQLQKIQDIIIDDVPAVPLYLRNNIYVANADLKGVVVDGNTFLDATKLSW